MLHGDQADQVFLDVFLQAFSSPPEEIVLDLDATDDPLHGEQEGRFFHGYYDCYCYLPLYIFCGEHLLCARLRQSNIDASAGALDEIERIVQRIKCIWPEVRIILRGDSGFCRDEIMAWCEANQVHYVFGLARNPRLERRVARSLAKAKRRSLATGKGVRVFQDLSYRTQHTWTRRRRVVAKAEYLRKGQNPRFIVTSLSPLQWRAQPLYEELYCARGDMENRIKEQQLYLFADRTSAHEFRANQIRLYLSSMAYVLMSALRRLALFDTELTHAQCHTIRIKLLKVGAQIRVTMRKIWISLSESYPNLMIFTRALENLRASPA